jgi:mRNA-degrading endonuclease RelE of RelBE toxin-antitoxin system
MRYAIVPTKFLLEQIGEFDKKTRQVLYNKRQLIEINPFRYKHVDTPLYRHVFSVKFSHRGEDKRLIYVVIKNKIYLCFILDRSKQYKDLERYSKRSGGSLNQPDLR